MLNAPNLREQARSHNREVGKPMSIVIIVPVSNTTQNAALIADARNSGARRFAP